MAHRAVFLDRDGVIIADGASITDISHVRILPGVPEAIRTLNDAGFKVIVVTNQGAIARGKLTERGLGVLHEHLCAQLTSMAGAQLDGIYFCPHHPDADVSMLRKECDCRKPRPGMLLTAAKAHDIDATESYMVGDRLSDIYAGKTAGCKMNIQVLSGEHGAKPIVSASVSAAEITATKPDVVCADLTAAVKLILEEEMTMKALILSAGKGTRVSGITNDAIPKVMLPIAGKPVLQWHIEHLKKHGMKDILINLHFRPEVIQDHFGDGSRFGARIRYNFEPSLMGTAGALHGFKDAIDDTLVVFYGDIMNEIDLKKFVAYHKSKGSKATLVVQETNRPHDCDIIEVDQEMRVKAVHRTPGNAKYGKLGNSACYVIEPEVLKYLPAGPCDFIKDVFPKMLAAGEPVFGYKTDEFLEDMGTPERYAAVKARYENATGTAQTDKERPDQNA